MNIKSFKEFILESIHPQRGEYGEVKIFKPHKDSNISEWNNPEGHGRITPESDSLPESLNGIEFTHWDNYPKDQKKWNSVSGQGSFDEPPLPESSSKALASGVIIKESDSRVWVVHPTNEFAGVKGTFPKGKVDRGLNLRANAIKEAFEESGLKVKLKGFAGDSERTTSITRYYFGERVGGHPKKMGWETQAVSLVPISKLKSVLNLSIDHDLIDRVFSS